MSTDEGTFVSGGFPLAGVAGPGQLPVAALTVF